MSFIRRIERKIRARLSHYPKAYALTVGIGVVLFWRGVWHTVDLIHNYIDHYKLYSTIDFSASPWWDGPLSFIIGVLVLYSTGAFVSSFIGNELILSGLRGERRLTEQAEEGVQNEVRAIADIQDEITIISQKMQLLEKQINHRNHTS